MVDDYHGTLVADPYRWAEDPDSEETKAFIVAQNTLTQAYLSEITARGVIKSRLTQLWNFPRWSPPSRVGGQYFFSKNDGLQNQPVIYRQPTLDAEPTSGAGSE